MTRPYEYVRKTYGVDPIPGHRCRLENTVREGVIVRRRAYDHHVWVRFDDAGFATPCHPTSLIYLTGASA